MKGLWELVKTRRKDATSSESTALHKDEEDTVEEVADAIGKSRFVEFQNGSHNDTCVQPGYWTAIAEFIASISN